MVIMLQVCDEPTLRLCDFCNKRGGELAAERSPRVITSRANGLRGRMPHCAPP